ncbi:hypothetical protein NQZ79_g2698 [Umbelopsis isabellina]|nr:hypothetical protein NQZ79_g2698 [Umbelopsis isabellina]
MATEQPSEARDKARLEMDPQRLESIAKRAQEVIQNDQKVVPPFWISKYKKEASRNWDIFYKRNTTKFFKDRYWLDREFEELAHKGDESKEKKICLEVGCGVGNFVFPTLAKNPNLFIYACDFSSRAVGMVQVSELLAFQCLYWGSKHSSPYQANEQYNESRCKAFVADLTVDDLCATVPAESVDLVSAIFVLSAIPPEKMSVAIQNIYKVNECHNSGSARHLLNNIGIRF